MHVSVTSTLIELDRVSREEHYHCGLQTKISSRSIVLANRACAVLLRTSAIDHVTLLARRPLTMQVAYGTQAFQLQQAALNQGADMRNYREPARSVFRLQVHNVPQYLSLEEFRNQFMKLEGCVNAFVEKSDTGYVFTTSLHIDQRRPRSHKQPIRRELRMGVQDCLRVLRGLRHSGLGGERRFNHVELEGYA